MKIKKKWQAAAAGAIAFALVGAGATAANAAPGDPLNPQPAGSAAEGSKGGFFLYDGLSGERVDTDPATVFTRDQSNIGSASATDVLAEINPSATRPVSGGTSFTGVYRFLSAKDPADRDGGVNTWNAYAIDGAAGPNGGTLVPDLALDSFVDGPGGIADDIASGGSFWYGLAYTNQNGVQVVGTVYREITITAGSGNYTVTPSVVEAGPVGVTVTTQPANVSVAPGADATFTAAATPAAATVQWEVSTDGTTWAPVAGATNPTLTVSAVTFAQDGDQYRAVFTDGAQSATSNAATLTVVANPVTEADLTPGLQNAGLVTETADSTTLAIAGGSGLAGQTLNVGSFPAGLTGTVTLDASGNGTIDAASIPVGQATKLYLAQASNNGVVAWDTFELTVTDDPTDGVDQEKVKLIVDVTASNRFEIIANANWVNPVDLGDVRRNVLSPVVKLGDFRVVDDRNVLTGWTLNATTAVFDGVNTDATIAADALGFDFFTVGGVLTGVTDGPAKPAGNGVATGVAATGADATSTTEEGAVLNADLTFLAPASAVRDTYTSTLTLDLIAD